MRAAAEIVVLDIEADGFADFEKCEGKPADDIETPAASTAKGGRHLYYAANGRFYRNTVKFGGKMDTRTSGGYVVLPAPDNGRHWIKPLTVPFAPAPIGYRGLSQRTIARRAETVRRQYTLCAGRARERLFHIETAPNGEQGDTLRRECFSMGGYVGGGELDKEATIAALTEAALKMPVYDKRRPWRGLDRRVREVGREGDGKAAQYAGRPAVHHWHP